MNKFLEFMNSWDTMIILMVTGTAFILGLWVGVMLFFPPDLYMKTMFTLFSCAMFYIMNNAYGRARKIYYMYREDNDEV